MSLPGSPLRLYCPAPDVVASSYGFARQSLRPSPNAFASVAKTAQASLSPPVGLPTLRAARAFEKDMACIPFAKQ